MDQQNLPKRPILVTGGAGFIGSHLCEALLARGERVLCLDNFTDFYSPARKRANIAGCQKNNNFTLIKGDVQDRKLVMQLFEEWQPDRVAHLAAMANVRYSVERAALYASVNYLGTIHLLDAARQAGAGNFVFASTSSIYGAMEEIPFKEDQPADEPLAPYPASKKAAEVMGHAYHNVFGLNFTALRFFTAYGPRVRPDMMAYIVMDRIVRGEEIILYNKGDMYRDWTYIEDIIEGITAAIDTPLGYEILNLGRGEPVRLGDFVEIIEDLVGKPANLAYQPAPSSEPPITYASTEKAHRLLGYKAHTSITDGLGKTWEWYRMLTQNTDDNQTRPVRL